MSRLTDLIEFARMKLSQSWEATQIGETPARRFEIQHEAQTAILDAIEELAAELHGAR